MAPKGAFFMPGESKLSKSLVRLISQDNGPDFEFKGEQVAAVSGTFDNVALELKLYRTLGEKLIILLKKQCLTCEEKANSNYYAKVFSNEQELIDEFGYSKLMKGIYDQADICHTVFVE